jgi:hypothetical protein
VAGARVHISFTLEKGDKTLKKLVLVFGIAMLLSSSAMAVDIAISTKSGWWGQAAADQEMQDIVNNVQGASVEVFSIDELDALADWIIAHTGNGAADLLIMCGNFPDTLYPAGNAEPDGSLAESFLDDGNTIINTGDYIFYVGTAANNDAGGLQNMMDLPGISMWGDGTPCVPTAEALEITPSLVEIPSTRPFFFDQLEGDWYAELILGQTADGAVGDPVIVRNSVTGGRVGIFFQVADALTDIRGEVISEWINNWYLKNVSSNTISRAPVPASEAIDVSRDIDLSWTAGAYAVTHDVYLGTVWEDVNAGTGDLTTSMGQADTSFDPGRLAFGQTYFWRVDEVNGAPDNTVFKGGVWSFEVEPVAYPITNITATASSQQSPQMSPDKTIDGSGLNELDQHGTLAVDMWLSGMGDPNPSIQYEFDATYKLHQALVWNSNQLIESFVGLGSKDVVIETSLDGAEWTALEASTLLNQAPGAAGYEANTTIDFGGIMAQYVRITVNSGWGMMPQSGLSEVRFTAIPTAAREPMPADGVTTDSVGVVLGWRAGREAASHEVYVGTDSADLPLVATVTENSVDLSSQSLAYATTYFWTVKEVNEAETPTAHDGPVWSFTTPDYGTVDSFDQYDDNCMRIFFAWEDGLGHNGGEDVEDCDVPASNGNGGGSIVGNAQAPFAERDIVNAGSRQSMPFNYDNAFGDSFTTLVIDGQDWTASDVQTLSLAFSGEAGNTGNLYVKINNTKISYDGPAVNIARPAWQVWNIVLADTGASLGNITSFAVGVDGGSASGMLYIDDIRLYPVIFEAGGAMDITTPGDTIQGVPNDQDWPSAEAPEFAIDDNSGTKYLHFKGEEGITGFQVTPSVGATIVTGLAFTTANDADGRDPIAYELSGSNAGIEGPFTVIAAGDIVDFSQATAWPRFTANETKITFTNTVAYAHYQLIVTAIRGTDMMQIAEVELIGEL